MDGLTLATASATLVRTAGRREWMSSFCSMRVKRRMVMQCVGPRFFSNSIKDAPLKQHQMPTYHSSHTHKHTHTHRQRHTYTHRQRHTGTETHRLICHRRQRRSSLISYPKRQLRV